MRVSRPNRSGGARRGRGRPPEAKDSLLTLIRDTGRPSQLIDIDTAVKIAGLHDQTIEGASDIKTGPSWMYQERRHLIRTDIAVLFVGHEAVKQALAAEGPVGLLEWTYEDPTVRVRDGVDSYVIENGKIVGQTIHYTLERRSDLPSSTDAT